MPLRETALKICEFQDVSGNGSRHGRSEGGSGFVNNLLLPSRLDGNAESSEVVLVVHRTRTHVPLVSFTITCVYAYDMRASAGTRTFLVTPFIGGSRKHKLVGFESSLDGTVDGLVLVLEAKGHGDDVNILLHCPIDSLWT